MEVIFSWTITPDQVIPIEHQQIWKLRAFHTLTYSLFILNIWDWVKDLLSRPISQSTQYLHTINQKNLVLKHLCRASQEYKYRSAF